MKLIFLTLFCYSFLVNIYAQNAEKMYVVPFDSSKEHSTPRYYTQYDGPSASIEQRTLTYQKNGLEIKCYKNISSRHHGPNIGTLTFKHEAQTISADINENCFDLLSIVTTIPTGEFAVIHKEGKVPVLESFKIFYNPVSKK